MSRLLRWTSNIKCSRVAWSDRLDTWSDRLDTRRDPFGTRRDRLVRRRGSVNREFRG